MTEVGPAGRSGAWRQCWILIRGTSGASQRQFRSSRPGTSGAGGLLGHALIAGAVLDTGTRSYTYDDRLHVLPIDRLWRQSAGTHERP